MTVYALDGKVPALPAEGEYWIAPGAHVLGNVRLERNVSIWFGSVLRGDNELILIGENSNIQDQCMLHTDPGFPITVGANCTVGHKATLHGCTVAPGTLIGMGATLLNGSRVGTNCIVGAHALIAEGKDIPDNSLVLGAPGRVARTLGEAEARMIARATEHYVRNWQRFASGLKPL